ncbi:g8135 [Coccomyxa elongata]
MCFSANQVDGLPADIYPCKYYQTPVTASTCDGLDKDACKETGSCAWCESAAVGNACYPAADVKRLPPAIFNCTTNAAAAGRLASASIAAPPTEVSQGGQDATSLLDAGAISTEGSQNGVKELANANIGSRAQEFSFASKVSNSVSFGSADLAAP